MTVQLSVLPGDPIGPPIDAHEALITHTVGG